jgi:hypothetical protein
MTTSRHCLRLFSAGWAVLFFGGIGVVRAEFREFKDGMGRKVMAELLSHDGAGQLSLKMENGTLFQKAANQFSPEDQPYITEWIKRTPAATTYRFDIKALPVKITGNRKDMGYKTVKNELWTYKVDIRNTARNPVQNLKVEYRVFVQNEADGSFASDDNSGFLSGDAAVEGPLRFNELGSFNTIEVKIDVVDYRYSSSRRDRHVDALRGLMLRIKDARGNTVQEWVSPITTLRGKTWDNIPKALEIKSK